MKTSAITRLLLVLLGAPELLQGRVIPSKGLEQRFVDLNPSLNATDLTRCGIARCQALGVVVDKRAGAPIAGGAGRAGAAAGAESGAGRAAGEAAGGASPPRIGSGSSAGGGESSSGAQTGGPLGDFGTGQSSTGKRPLDSPTEPPAKIPNTGTADDALAGDASPSSGEDLDIYEVKASTADDADVIDNISIDKEQKIIFSDDLNNDLDPTTNRAKLWEVEMSLFVHQSGQAPSDLRGISYGGVSEQNTKPTIDSIVARRGESFGIDRTSTDAQDQTDFQAFLDTKLGKSTQTLLRNSPVGKDITRIEVGPGNLEDLDLKFFFG
ncbi:hypothetical protein PG984_004083 [Apiospora sp. TS-2023a]